jgi:hypothetical protein
MWGHLNGAKISSLLFSECPPMALARSMDQDDIPWLFRNRGEPFPANPFSYLIIYQDGTSLNVSYRNISFQSLLLFKPSMSTVKSFSCSPNSFTEVYCVAFAVLLPTWRRLDRCQRFFRIFTYASPLLLPILPRSGQMGRVG